MESSNPDRLKGWNKDEKLLFYQALRNYGSHDISAIQDYIPNKSKKEIEDALNFFKSKALKQEEDCFTTKENSRTNSYPHVPLNSWAKLLTDTIPFEELRTETATALRLIADFEDIPQAVCTERIDFRKVYHTLANALEGKPLCEDKYVAALIDKCIIETALTSKAFLRCNTLKKALKNVRINENPVSPFIKQTDNNELSMLRHLLMLRNYNPMNITEEHLKFSLLL